MTYVIARMVGGCWRQVSKKNFRTFKSATKYYDKLKTKHKISELWIVEMSRVKKCKRRR